MMKARSIKVSLSVVNSFQRVLVRTLLLAENHNYTISSPPELVRWPEGRSGSLQTLKRASLCLPRTAAPLKGLSEDVRKQ